MVKILFVFTFLFSSNLFAIEFFKSGDPIEASKINEVISNSMRIYEKSGTNGFLTSSTSKVLVPGRTVVIEKKYDETAILMNYSDAFRSNQVNKMCTIYLEIDGQVCSNPINFKSVYSAESLDINALSIMGYCAGLPKGTYTAKVMVKNGAYSVGGYAGTVNVCEFTWADNSSYTLTAKEVLVN